MLYINKNSIHGFFFRNGRCVKIHALCDEIEDCGNEFNNKTNC